jgi:replication factor C small subunit
MLEQWEEKHRPKSLSDYIFRDAEQKRIIEKIIQDKNIPHILLAGHRGTGKTSLAYLLKSELNIDDFDFMKINASKENSVDILRNKISDFITTAAFGDCKVVLLDEADRLSPAFQDTLRGMLEEHVNNARFIFTCNHPRKIIPELKSRLVEIVFKSLDKDLMITRFVNILRMEKVKIKDPDIIVAHIDQAYPDFRKLLVTAQMSIVDGALTSPVEASSVVEDFITIVEMLNIGDWAAARKHVCGNLNDDQIEDFYRFLYDHLHEIESFTDSNKWKQGIVVLSDHLYRSAFVADQEINLAACMIKLSNIIEESK